MENERKTRNKTKTDGMRRGGDVTEETYKQTASEGEREREK